MLNAIAERELPQWKTSRQSSRPALLILSSALSENRQRLAVGVPTRFLGDRGMPPPSVQRTGTARLAARYVLHIRFHPTARIHRQIQT